MKKEIRKISDDGKTVQITVADERWYIKTNEDGSTVEYPSVTWIADNYPKGVGFYMWLAKKGWDESESIKESAGNRGTKVHQAISELLLGNAIAMDGTLRNSDTGEPEPITLEEYEAIMSFADWHKETKPKVLANEIAVFNEKERYAGTIDLLCEIEGEKWLIDFKTSADIWPSHELQISAYKHADIDSEMKPEKLGILQVGYRRNKKKFKFTEIEDQFDLFLAAKMIWKKECSNVTTFVKDYPTSITL